MIRAMHVTLLVSTSKFMARRMCALHKVRKRVEIMGHTCTAGEAIHVLLGKTVK